MKKVSKGFYCSKFNVRNPLKLKCDKIFKCRESSVNIIKQNRSGDFPRKYMTCMYNVHTYIFYYHDIFFYNLKL